MEKLFEYSKSRINAVNTEFKRYLHDQVNWNNRLIAITGARGIGKTTLLLQHIKETQPTDLDQVIYVNLDDLYFSKNTIVDFADTFVKQGGKYLFLDEVHKYKNWSREIKNVYDYFSDLHIVITGSSALNIFKGEADLSRRAVMYKMQGLSFREFIEMKYRHSFPVLKLNDLLTRTKDHVSEILKEIKPIKLFTEYLKLGYYPFFIEDEELFHVRLRQTVNHVLDSDLPSVENIDYTSVHRLRKLLSIITEIVPFKPNISKLSMQVAVSRETLVKYLYLLTRADLIMMLKTDASGISEMNKPEKIYLNNPNLIYALADRQVNKGTLRETFFYNQLSEKHTVLNANKGDFTVDGKYTFEIGGKSKTQKQIQGLENAWIAMDDLEYPHQNKIPLWLFGFLY